MLPVPFDERDPIAPASGLRFLVQAHVAFVVERQAPAIDRGPTNGTVLRKNAQ